MHALDWCAFFVDILLYWILAIKVVYAHASHAINLLPLIINSSGLQIWKREPLMICLSYSLTFGWIVKRWRITSLYFTCIVSVKLGALTEFDHVVGHGKTGDNSWWVWECGNRSFLVCFDGEFLFPSM